MGDVGGASDERRAFDFEGSRAGRVIIVQVEHNTARVAVLDGCHTRVVEAHCDSLTHDDVTDPGQEGVPIGRVMLIDGTRAVDDEQHIYLVAD